MQNIRRRRIIRILGCLRVNHLLQHAHIRGTKFELLGWREVAANNDCEFCTLVMQTIDGYLERRPGREDAAPEALKPTLNFR